MVLVRRGEIVRSKSIRELLLRGHRRREVWRTPGWMMDVWIREEVFGGVAKLPFYKRSQMWPSSNSHVLDLIQAQ